MAFHALTADPLFLSRPKFRAGEFAALSCNIFLLFCIILLFTSKGHIADQGLGPWQVCGSGLAGLATRLSSTVRSSQDSQELARGARIKTLGTRLEATSFPGFWQARGRKEGRKELRDIDALAIFGENPIEKTPLEGFLKQSFSSKKLKKVNLQWLNHLRTVSLVILHNRRIPQLIQVMFFRHFTPV